MGIKLLRNMMVVFVPNVIKHDLRKKNTYFNTQCAVFPLVPNTNSQKKKKKIHRDILVFYQGVCCSLPNKANLTIIHGTTPTMETEDSLRQRTHTTVHGTIPMMHQEDSLRSMMH